MKFIPNAVTAKLSRQILLSQKHSPTILFVGGVVGVVATTVLACRATLKLDDILEKSAGKRELAKTIQDEDYSKEDSQKDIAIIYVKNVATVVKLYAPSVIVGTLSIAALTGSHRILSGRNVALTAAYTALEKGFTEYRERVVEEYGEEKDRELRYGTEMVQITDEKGKISEEKRVNIRGASVNARYFGQNTSSSWEPSYQNNLFFLKCVQNWANDKLRMRGHMTLNDVYDMLGLERSREGCVIGWLWDEKGKRIDLGIFDRNTTHPREFIMNDKSILLDFNVDPGVIWDKI